jgi:hypothetical protein
LLAWALAAGSAWLYAICLQGLPDSSSDHQFYLWAVGVSAAPSLIAVATLVRSRLLGLALLTATAAGLAVAYALALLTYGSGAEDGTIWRGLGGAVLGAISAIAAWIVMRLNVHRAKHPRAT